MVKHCKILAFLLTLVLLCSITIPVIAVENDVIDILFVVESVSEQEHIFAYSNIAEYENNISIEVITQSELQSSRIPEIRAIAVPVTIADVVDVDNIYAAGVRVYLYGDLTINDYIEYTGLQDFTSQLPIYEPNGDFSGKYMERGFPESQKNTKQYQIICEPQDDAYGLLCTIDKQNNGNRIETYMNIIAENYMAANVNQRATIVSSDYDIVHYYFDDNCSVHLSWILYRNYDEEDANYDYFALESRVWGEGSDSLTIGQTTCEHSLVYSTDYMIDSGPESDSSANSVSFSLDVSGEGITGGTIAYNYNLESAPKITRDTSNYPDSVAWTVSKRLLGSSLDNDIFKFATSWASSGSLSRIDVEFSNTASGSLLGQSVTMPSGTQTESISFSY